MYRIGIDLGGTNTAAGLVDARGKIIDRESVKTNLPTTLEHIVENIAALCRKLMARNGLEPKDICLVGVGVLTTEQAREFGTVGPFARACGLAIDVRPNGDSAYDRLTDFAPVVSNDCDCYARCYVRIQEVVQSIDIIKELAAKVPEGDLAVPVKGSPADGAQSSVIIEQPRGEAYYYAMGNGSKFLERCRVRTPTSQNIAGMVKALEGCDLSDVNMIILTIDPCISCTER